MVGHNLKLHRRSGASPVHRLKALSKWFVSWTLLFVECYALPNFLTLSWLVISAFSRTSTLLLIFYVGSLPVCLQACCKSGHELSVLKTKTVSYIKKHKKKFSEWCHVLCGFWLPGTQFYDPVMLSPILVKDQSIDSRTTARAEVWAYFASAPNVLEAPFRPDHGGAVRCTDGHCCVICHTVWGLTVKCQFRGCKKRFHPTCARGASVYMAIEAGADETHRGVRFQIFCEQHTATERPAFVQRTPLTTTRNPAGPAQVRC